MAKNELREKTYYLIFGGILAGLKDYELYSMFHNLDPETVNRQKVYAWIHGAKIGGIVTAAKMAIEKIKEETGRGANVENQAEPATMAAAIDFTNKSEFIKYLNQAANRIQDDKLKNDILKMLSDHLDFKDENKRDESNQIQRFYLPLRCQNCAIYQKVSENSEL